MSLGLSEQREHDIAHPLRDKVVVITGAAQGQGAAEVLELARRGATVVATDVTPTSRWHHAIPEGAAIEYHALDVAQPDDWAALASHCADRYGTVHGLVSNAGVTERARLLDVDVLDWERTLRVNVTGGLLGIQALAPHMRPGSSIVLIGSLAGLTGHFPVAYTVSKWALRGLARVASMELGPRGIRVNIVHPGHIETPMTQSAPHAYIEHNLAAAPLGRLGTTNDVAPLVAFLLSEESAYISGAEIPVDGGQWAHGGLKGLSDLARQQTTD
jgi:3alpha(or 20beta)-hydroxysteroid dehydrogenase